MQINLIGNYTKKAKDISQELSIIKNRCSITGKHCFKA